MRTLDLVKFIIARDSVRAAKDMNKPKPWTDDPILQRYRFCNVRREDDAVTRWIAKNWRDNNADYEDLWFSMVVARLLNNPETLGELNPYIPTLAGLRRALKNRRDRGDKVFNAAYIVSTNGISMDKIDYIIDIILEPLWKDRVNLRPRDGDFLESFHTRLTAHRGMGSFMAGQVVADMKYVLPLRGAADWATWAASGPGSRRGLNRLMGRDKNMRWKEQDWLTQLQHLQKEVNAALDWRQKLHAQDLQNCLCEFDKYERVRLGEGTPKQRYEGTI